MRQIIESTLVSLDGVIVFVVTTGKCVLGNAVLDFVQLVAILVYWWRSP